MSDNKALWRRVCVTDPKAVKPITGKQYNGNSPKPYWIVERLTDEFGPCGIGWGFTILGERFERFSDTDTLHVAAVRLWYMLDGKRGEFEQIGQTKASYTTAAGKFMLDEDAPKKSVTDALVKCASYLGFAGDIFSGRWDDSRYVAQANAEWREREAAEAAEAAGPHADSRAETCRMWTEETIANINAAKNAGEFKRIVSEALAFADRENNLEMRRQIQAAADAKAATAKARAAA